jgi:uncharacterized protein
MNHLANSQSLYLRKHAENPIDWWYWGDRALELAKQQNKPIFLSIGYSSCHWCTVMEGEAFSNLDIAAYLNENFIPIKVDREERPDLDSIYMSALQMMTGQGGWPLNIFLTPDGLIPFYGGTYFPVEPRYGRPSFLETLKAIRRFYDLEREKLENITGEILDNLRQSTILPPTELDVLTLDLLYRGMDVNAAVISPRNAEIDRPCFPMIPYTNSTLQGSRFEGKAQFRYEPLTTAKQRGLDLALGGIFDRVGGGFHRYTVDATWTVPHFEKMLYDNGQILEYLSNLWSAGDTEPALGRAVDLTVKWLRREMTAPEGYFYAAQDADNFATQTDKEPEEGAFYVWDYSTLEQICSPAVLELLQQYFTVTPNGNFEGKNVLQRLQSGELPPEIETVLAELFTLRYGVAASEIDTFPPAKSNYEAKMGNWRGRIPPVTDTKMILAWNALAISGLARAYGVFGDRSYLDLAIDATNFILSQQHRAGRWQRLHYDGEATIPAQAEDYAYFVKALLDLQTVVIEDNKWLETAIEVQKEFDELLWSEETGGYYNNSLESGADLIVRERSYIDNATPSPNGIAVINLMRLFLLTDNPEYLDRASQTLQAFGSIIQNSPQACPSLYLALDWYHNGKAVKTHPETIAELMPLYLPTTVFRLATDLQDGAVGMVCRASACLQPARDKEMLLEQLYDI